MIKVAINGFGRIGRNATRVFFEHPDLQGKMELAAINTSGSLDVHGWGSLLRYDSAQGRFRHPLKVEETRKPKETTDESPEMGSFSIGQRTIPILAQRDPAKLPWEKYGVDVVLECTGVFRSKEKASAHIQAGAKKVLLSAPGKGEGIVSKLMGIDMPKAGEGDIYDNASCTTNCIAPVMHVLVKELGVEKAMMSTVHAYTDSQNIQDGSHNKDLYRARAAAANIVPTSTGAATALAGVIPELQGIFDGMAIRVPVITGSAVDVTAVVKRETSIEEINSLFDRYAAGELKGILASTDEPLVSSDVIGQNESSIVAKPFTNVQGGDLVKVIAWYDNEWGYCCRLMEMAHAVGAVA